MDSTAPDSKISVAIMAGGKSSRMGTDKSFVLFHGRPLIERVIDKVSALGDELLIITNRSEDYAGLGYPIFADIYRDAGPLGGLHSALKHAKHPHIFVVACDMPWLNKRLLSYMLSHRMEADIVVPRWNRFPEPLHAVYSRACLGPIVNNLEARRLKLTAFYGQLRVRYIERNEISMYDPAGRSFANVNTPDDLAAVRGEADL